MDANEIGEVMTAAREAKRLSQEQLADATGVGQSTIARIEAGDFKRLPSVLPKICAYLGVPLPEFGAAPLAPGVAIPRARIFSDRLMPLHAAAQGGPGEIIVDSGAIDFIPRPAHVQHVQDAYGLLITGDSMYPEYRAGQVAFVNPRLPVIPGEVYIFYAEKEGEARATIKELNRQSDKEWRVKQHNPEREFPLQRKEWRWAHRVVGKQARTT